jgi:hypothetical protein
MQQALLTVFIIIIILIVALITFISYLNIALGAHTLVVVLAIWSIFFGMAYVGMHAYNTTIGTVTDTENDGIIGTNAANLTAGGTLQTGAGTLAPLSDDFLKKLDEELSKQDPVGLEPLFQGDTVSSGDD